MSTLQDVVDQQIEAGKVPGAIAAVWSAGEGPDIAVGGVRAIGGDPMTRDTIVRIASLTKPITAAATMALVERGTFGLDDPVATWLPELASPSVVRTPSSPLDDVVPAVRPITIRHLLTFQSGHGFPADVDLPVAQHLFAERLQGPPRPQESLPTDAWMAALGAVPLLHQPGEGWLYNTGSDVLGVLLGRAAGAGLEEVLVDTVLAPLGMDDTRFSVPAADVGRLATQYARGEDGGLVEIDPPDGQWASPPPFASGAGGLVSTIDDCLAFQRMLLAEGGEVLSPGSVRLMMTAHAHAEPDSPFLQGEAWGFGGSVDVDTAQPWNVPGRYGWTGGTGTAGYVIPATGRATVWLGQVEMAGPDDFSALAAFLTWAGDPLRSVNPHGP